MAGAGGQAVRVAQHRPALTRVHCEVNIEILDVERFLVRVTTRGYTSKDGSRNSASCGDKLISDFRIVEANACQGAEHSIWEEPINNKLIVTSQFKASNNNWVIKILPVPLEQNTCLFALNVVSEAVA